LRNLLGASLGAWAFDVDLLDGLEGREVITRVADDLHDVFARGREARSPLASDTQAEKG
jgi:hypothetical protein